MKNILVYGENPFSFSGNGNMLNSLLSTIDREKYHASCLVIGDTDPALFDIYRVPPFNLIDASVSDRDKWGLGYVLRTLSSTKTDVFLTVGIDLWRFVPALKQLKQVLHSKKIPWMCIAPYDVEGANPDWIQLFKQVDFPCVYSMHGYNILKRYIPNVKYYRPDLFGKQLFQRVPKEVCATFKESHFREMGDDPFMFGFIGNNQVRKEPHKVLKAFMGVKDKLKNERNVGLYMHTSLKGVYDLEGLGRQWGIKGSIGFKSQGVKYPIHNMAMLYNSLDCVVLPSLQEGLSWTVLEAMLCKTPILASDSTAHRELLPKRSMIPCTEMTMIPIGEFGNSYHVESKACSLESITTAMINAVRKPDKGIIEENHKKAMEWLSGVSNINEHLDNVVGNAKKTGGPQQATVTKPNESSSTVAGKKADLQGKLANMQQEVERYTPQAC